MDPGPHSHPATHDTKNPGRPGIVHFHYLCPLLLTGTAIMSKSNWLLLTALLSVLHAEAQDYAGYRSSNYTGVNGVFFNPSNIADNRFQWDVNLAAVNGFMGYNCAGLKLNDISHAVREGSLRSVLLQGNARISGLSSGSLLGPSFMIGLGPRTSIAFSSRARFFGNAKDVHGDLVNAVADAWGEKTIPPIGFGPVNSFIHSAGWAEFGGTFAQVLTRKGSRHFLKGGITLKYLAGSADSYLALSNMNGTVVNDGGSAYLSGPVSGSLAFRSTATNFLDYRIKDAFTFSGSGFGGDIGLVYEWRTRTDYSIYKSDRFANKYKLKIGFALLDFGKIRFSKSNNTAAAYTVNVPAGDRYTLGFLYRKPIYEFKSVLDASPAYFASDASPGNSYSVSLPATLQGEADWLIGGGFALNGYARVNVNKKKELNLYDFNAYALTPRWENSWFSAALPVSYNEITQLNVGLGLRAGPLFLGSGSILSMLVSPSKQADFYIGVHFGIPYKKKVRMDTDLDGVYDSEDKCPTVAGSPKYQGCPVPDTDGDGVDDEADSCISVPGLARYHGCPVPDSDHDGINDEEDSCVHIAGLPEFHGCPVPDKDGDGIPDSLDKCPDVAGTAKYQGCPVLDTDGDGLNDDEDLCPNQPGPLLTRGCPVEDEVAMEITAEFSNILFDFGRTTIRPGSLEIIRRAAKTMNEQIPNSNFYIDGYTDNVGDDLKNKRISLARAQAVADALMRAGVAGSRMTVRGFGKENPKCDNATEAGRKCNRRVEVLIRNVDQHKVKKGIRLM
jgi:outer membrane protein OmpA-like peptidoglycan-associated protein